MTDTLKEKIIIRFIKTYKNRIEWEDDFVRDKYSDVIDYLMENFDKFFNSVNDNPDGGIVKKRKQGEREIEYDTSMNTSNDKITSIVKNDLVLSSLLGLPLIKLY